MRNPANLPQNPLVTLLAAASAPQQGGAAGWRQAVMRIERRELAGREPRLVFVASTGREDRYGEIIDQRGWELTEFRRNPVFLSGHRFSGPTSVLGKVTECGVKDVPMPGTTMPALLIEVQFAVEEHNAARVAYNMYRGGFMNAVSVGFMPMKWEDVQHEGRVIRIYRQQELLEVSAVGIPVNPDALIVPGA